MTFSSTGRVPMRALHFGLLHIETLYRALCSDLPIGLTAITNLLNVFSFVCPRGHFITFAALCGQLRRIFCSILLPP